MEALILASTEHTKRQPSSAVYTSSSARPTQPDTIRNTMSPAYADNNVERFATTPPTAHSDAQSGSHMSRNPNMSPAESPTPKTVAFELLVPNTPQYRARLPMRVGIYPHDTTDSIVTTVKNFYGLYNGGISFEDEQGNTLIARYENFRDKMNVYVRVVEEPTHTSAAYGPTSYHSISPAPGQQSYYNGDNHHMPPPHPAQALTYGQSVSRPASRASRKRSPSPNSGRGRRSASASVNPANKKARSASGYKSRGSSTHGGLPDIYSDGFNGYSSGDGAPGSVSSKTKSEHLGNTEISLDNIVEGGRRKRAKFESSVSHSYLYAMNIDCRALSNVFYFLGTSSICATSDACSYLKLVSIACEAHRKPKGLIAIHTSRTACICPSTSVTITPKLQ